MSSTRGRRAPFLTPDNPPSKRIKTDANADGPRRSRRLRGLRAAPPLELLDLPPEVFQHILSFLVQDIKGALRARHVSRFFKQEIDFEIFWSKALEKEEHLIRLPQPWRGKLMHLKAFSLRHLTASPFFHVIRLVVRSIVAYFGDRSPEMITNVASMVTALSSFYMTPTTFKSVFSDARPPVEITASTINRARICVSAFIGDYDMYRDFQSLELTPFQGINTYFGSPAWAAALLGRHEFLRRLQIDGISFYYGYNYGPFESPLRAACCVKNDAHKQCALILLDSMISSGQIHLEDLRSSLIYARETRFLRLFLLLTEPAVRDLVKIELENVLHLENGDDSYELTELLITRGVDPNTRALLDLLELSSTSKLATPLQDAVNKRKRARINLLLAHGADPNMVTSADGLSPIEVALRQRSPDVVDALLRHGAAKYAVANPTNNGGFNILTHPDAWADPPTWKVCLSHFDTRERHRLPTSPVNGYRLYRTIMNDYAHAYAALFQAASRGRTDLVLLLIDRGVSIHGRWDPPLPAVPDLSSSRPVTRSRSRPQASAVVDDPPLLPRRRVVLARPAIDAALQAGDQAMVNLMLEHGAVFNYPYDYLLREPGESATDVNKRIAHIRQQAYIRDRAEDRKEMERERAARRRALETRAREGWGVTMRAANASQD